MVVVLRREAAVRHRPNWWHLAAVPIADVPDMGRTLLRSRNRRHTCKAESPPDNVVFAKAAHSEMCAFGVVVRHPNRDHILEVADRTRGMNPTVGLRVGEVRNSPYLTEWHI